MDIQHKINQVKAWWRKEYLAPSQSRPKATLQHAIEEELARLKQENAPLNKQMPQQEKQSSSYLGASLSNLFQR